MSTWIMIAPLVGLIGLLVAYLIFISLKKQPDGNDKMREIAKSIYDGAMAFLFREYKVLSIFVLIIFVLMLFAPSLGWKTALAFLVGALCSIIAGFFGMNAATKANVRTSEAARSGGLAKALFISYNGGAVMGLAVASLGLFGVGVLYVFFGSIENIQYINGFAMGASSIALFARVGGGIYTKAADVGSDLVGKVEAGIPEDDPRNPGVIADNVGDNVGDIAGMGADIFESYVGSIIATMAIAATASATLIASIGVTLLKSNTFNSSTIVLVVIVSTNLNVICSSLITLSFTLLDFPFSVLTPISLTLLAISLSLSLSVISLALARTLSGTPASLAT